MAEPDAPRHASATRATGVQEVGVGERITLPPGGRDTPYDRARLYWRPSDVFAMAFPPVGKGYHEVFRGVIAPRKQLEAETVMLRVGSVVEIDSAEMRHAVLVSILYYGARAKKAALTLVGVVLGEGRDREIREMRWTNLMDDTIVPGALVRLVGDVRDFPEQRKMMAQTLRGWQYGYVADALEEWEGMSEERKGDEWKRRVGDVLARSGVLAARCGTEVDVESLTLVETAEKDKHRSLVKQYVDTMWPPNWEMVADMVNKAFELVERAGSGGETVDAKESEEPQETETKKRKRASTTTSETPEKRSEEVRHSSDSDEGELSEPTKRAVGGQRRKGRGSRAVSGAASLDKPATPPASPVRTADQATPSQPSQSRAPPKGPPAASPVKPAAPATKQATPSRRQPPRSKAQPPSVPAPSPDSSGRPKKQAAPPLRKRGRSTSKFSGTVAPSPPTVEGELDATQQGVDVGPRLRQLEQDMKKNSAQLRRLTKEADTGLSEMAASLQSLRELLDVTFDE